MAKSSHVARRRLDLQELGQGYPCLTPESGTRLAWAAAVCLEEREHSAGVVMRVRGKYERAFALHWIPTNDQVQREWSDPQEATEHGACGLAILLIAKLTDYHIVQRSWKSTGFDYWLGRKNDLLFQSAARLEVSGIRRGDDKQIDRRARQKANQTDRSRDTRMPVFVVVVEFGRPVAVVMRR